SAGRRYRRTSACTTLTTPRLTSAATCSTTLREATWPISAPASPTCPTASPPTPASTGFGTSTALGTRSSGTPDPGPADRRTSVLAHRRPCPRLTVRARQLRPAHVVVIPCHYGQEPSAELRACWLAGQGIVSPTVAADPSRWLCL